MAKEYSHSSRWIRQQLDNLSFKKPALRPCPVVVVADMTFIKRTFGIAVIRAPHLKKNLVWTTALTENVEVYRELRWQLWTCGFEIQAAVIDGKPGLIEVFWDVPIQMCQFHQMQIMTRYLTTKPKLIAGQTLRQIALCLPKSTEEKTKKELDDWHEKWKDFLKEKTFNVENNHWFYTHKKLRSAYRSITKNL